MNVIKIALITISLGLSSNSFAKEFEAELVALDSVKGTFYIHSIEHFFSVPNKDCPVLVNTSLHKTFKVEGKPVEEGYYTFYGVKEELCRSINLL
ncbi:g132 [Yersinia phage phiR1-37]|uniref:hypothetical protein n=1 Tax=Yersinia phage phiR1-37 TaxID=331278 RepID=UPI00022DBD30|nr:hypothetical protein phiR1-37_gp132 [Yersinia phage phiR1-37]CCE26156.1 g132 [Yersinia phage phiR1-37]